MCYYSFEVMPIQLFFIIFKYTYPSTFLNVTNYFLTDFKKGYYFFIGGYKKQNPVCYMYYNVINKIKNV